MHSAIGIHKYVRRYDDDAHAIVQDSKFSMAKKLILMTKTPLFIEARVSK